MLALIRGIYISLKNCSVLSNLLFRYSQIQTQRNLVIVCKKKKTTLDLIDISISICIIVRPAYVLIRETQVERISEYF